MTAAPTLASQVSVAVAAKAITALRGRIVAGALQAMLGGVVCPPPPRSSRPRRAARGRLGIAAPEVLELAFGEDRVLVTANVGDFRTLAAAREVHAGILLLLDGGLRRDEPLECSGG